MTSVTSMGLPMVSAQQMGFTGRDVLRSVFYYKRVIVVSFAIPVVIALLVASVRQPTYTAEARLLVLPGEEYSYRSQVGNGPPTDLTIDRTQFAQSEVAILRDQKLQASAVEAVGPQRVFGTGFAADQTNALSRAMVGLGTDLTIIALPQSNTITLDYRNRDPVVAADFLNQLVKMYLAARPAVYNRSQSESMSAQRDRYAEQLRLADQALLDFGEKHQISNLDDQVTLLLKQQADQLQQETDLNQRILQVTGQVAHLREQLSRTPQTVDQFVDMSRSIASDQRTSDLSRLQSLRRELTSRYHEGAPQLLDVDRQIAETQIQLRGGSTRDLSSARQGRNSVYDDLSDTMTKLESERQGLEASIGGLKAARAATAARLNELNTAGQEYRTLRRERDVLDDTYKAFARNDEDARIADQLNRNRFGNVRLVQSATPPPNATNLRTLIVAGGVALGIVLAAAMVIVLTVLRQVVIDRAEAERKFGLPVLLTVNLSQGRRARQGQPEPGNGRSWI